ncbi:MAG: hypothetical protein FWF82_06600, partial [Oscillospiraceae bacterium]|nr:hypothetical protein [Oscillospiraceae bacterium]
MKITIKNSNKNRYFKRLTSRKSSVRALIAGASALACLIVVSVVGVLVSMAASDDYLDENGDWQSFPFTPLEIDGTETILVNTSGESEGWYTVDGSFEQLGTVTINGDIHIVLKNGCDWQFENAAVITVNEEHSLTIYAQSKDSDMGKLTV